MRNARYLRVFATGLCLGLLVLGLTPVSASSANISHSYHASGKITDGSIVSLDPKRSDYVEPSNTGNAPRLLGVAVAKNDSLLAVDSTNSSIQVATSGNATMLVSTLDGAIHVGDQVSVSPFNGVGMKAFPGAHVIGLAQTGFNKNSPGAVTKQVTDKNGRTSSIQVGFVRVGIAIGTNATSGNTDANLTGLQRLVKQLTGRTVSTFRIVLGLVVALIALTALISLTYASIYGSIISVGRNPLAKYAVYRTLGSVLGLGVLTAVIAVVTILLLFR